MKTDNRIQNLECVTMAENQRHAYRTGLRTAPQGERSYRATLTDSQAIEVFKRAQDGENRSAIARDYGVSRDVVNGIQNGRTFQRAIEAYCFVRQAEPSDVETAED